MLFIYLFVSLNDAISSSDYVASNGRMRVNNELEGFGGKRSWHNLRYYLSIFRERQRKASGDLSQDRTQIENMC
jgi:hypothetical protein